MSVSDWQAYFMRRAQCVYYNIQRLALKGFFTSWKVSGIKRPKYLKGILFIYFILYRSSRNKKIFVMPIISIHLSESNNVKIIYKESSIKKRGIWSITESESGAYRRLQALVVYTVHTRYSLPLTLGASGTAERKLLITTLKSSMEHFVLFQTCLGWELKSFEAWTWKEFFPQVFELSQKFFFLLLATDRSFFIFFHYFLPVQF